MRHALHLTATVLAVASCTTPANHTVAAGDGRRGAGAAAVLTGSVSAGGRQIPGAFVSAEPVGAPMRTVVQTDAAGRFSFASLPPGRYVVRAHRSGIGSVSTDTMALPATAPIDLTIGRDSTAAWATSAAYLSLLPDGETKRRFILDCTGCHQFDGRIAMPGGQPRTEAQWREAVTRMLSFAGAGTGFPIIAAERDADSTAAWLTGHLRASGVASPTDAMRPDRARSARSARSAVLTEYDYPVPQDLPHDLAVDGDGRVVITGMFTHRMWVLHPDSGRFEPVQMPLQQANPRAVDIDSSGAWWVVLGNPQQLARRDGATGAWSTHRIGMYPHSLALDRGRVWFNGHFTREPELLGYVEAASGAVRTFEIPNTPALRAGAGPIPYEIRASVDGTIWMTELHGNRIVGYSPEGATWDTASLPTPHSGPRRMDVDARGVLWIPAYAANMLVRFDPRARRFTEFRFPVPDALPYVVRVDLTRGTVWGATAAADALFAFDPATERFAVYPLPTPGALIRHIAVDARNGDVWAAYGASPGVPPKIVRLRVPRSR
jgi:virginiamycin B lyase